MSLRKKLAANPRIGYGVATGVLLASVLVFLFTRGGPRIGRDISYVWYYDLNTGEKYPVKRLDVGKIEPPQPAPSGPLKQDHGPLKAGELAGVRAYNYACESCDNDQFIGFLETYSLAYRDQIYDGSATVEGRSKNQWVKAPGDAPWVLNESREGYELVSNLPSRCGGKKLVRCEVNN